MFRRISLFKMVENTGNIFASVGGIILTKTVQLGMDYLKT